MFAPMTVVEITQLMNSYKQGENMALKKLLAYNKEVVVAIQLRDQEVAKANGAVELVRGYQAAKEGIPRAHEHMAKAIAGLIDY